VSWEDVQRAVGPRGKLGTVGSNSSDVRMWDSAGRAVYTLRSDNWNERIGLKSANELFVVVGNHQAAQTPSSITLRAYLDNFKTFGSYAGVDAHTASLWAGAVDNKVGVRFQAAFLPESSTTFCTEVYNYNTSDDRAPRNLLLLCTPQGTSAQQDGRGAKKLYTHSVATDGAVHRSFLEATRSSFAVGGSQKETRETSAEARVLGKAAAARLGTDDMGERFNVQMLVQVPIRQRPVVQHRAMLKHPASPKHLTADAVPRSFDRCHAVDSGAEPRLAFGASSGGVSNASRISRGCEFDVWGGLAVPSVERDPFQRLTATVTMYYTVVGGAPSPDDISKAMADLISLYESCGAENWGASSLSGPLTSSARSAIFKKQSTQPYVAHPT
jgi:hypothetical protein